jgi:hypothetical protein
LDPKNTKGGKPGMKIKVVANKTWEVDPLINALLNPVFKPKMLPYPVVINQPRLYDQGKTHLPRLVYQINGNIVEVWCIEDQMSSEIKSTSCTSEKIRIMPDIINDHEEPVDLVIAFGTAGHPDPDNNGSVSVGSYFFIHDGKDPSNKDPWDGNINGVNYVSKVLHRDVPENLKLLFTDYKPDEVNGKLLKPPLNPSTSPEVIIDFTSMAVSDINIIDYSCYKTEDFNAVLEAKKYAEGKVIVSVETTHGVIVANTFSCTGSPVVFISALTDQVGHFDQEVSPKPEAQNYTAAFNAGIYLSYVLANAGNL